MHIRRDENVPHTTRENVYGQCRDTYAGEVWQQSFANGDIRYNCALSATGLEEREMDVSDRDVTERASARSAVDAVDVEHACDEDFLPSLSDSLRRPQTRKSGAVPAPGPLRTHSANQPVARTRPALARLGSPVQG